MSFREKHLWISIVATVAVWGWYTWRMIERIGAGALRENDFAGWAGGLFVGCLVVVVLLEVGLTVFATLTTSKAEREARDERETLASLKASHVSLMALIALVVTLAGAMYLLGLAGGRLPMGPGQLMSSTNAWVLVANVLTATIIISELIRAAFTLALLRRLR